LRPCAKIACAFLGLWLLLLPPAAPAQPVFQTILTNGPASNRFNIVFLSEGYTTSQLAQFQIDATNALHALFAHQPYSEYSNYFNAFAISVASTNSGSTHPAYGQSRNTFFNSSYDLLNDYIITIPPNAFDPNYSHGQGKVDALLQSYMPNANLPVLLVNDSTSGGSDGFDHTAIASTAFGYPEILTHETGHVVANLGDEYDYTNLYVSSSTEDPNTTRQTNRSLIKWNAWISPATPVPTPVTSAFASAVGLFPGAHYDPTNWFRPQVNCLMRNQYSPFCAVCTETMVLSFYRKVRPVDAFLPAGTNLSVTATQALAFNLDLLQPASHSLSVQWSADSSPLSNATNASLTVLRQSLANGSHTITALVTDNTSLVRNDPTNLLVQTIAWTLNVSLPQLELRSPFLLPGGQFAFQVTGNAPQRFVVQTSTNLAAWLTFSTNSLVNGQFWFTNPTTLPRRFFRVKTPP